jgi:hypothetical protein
VSASCRTPERPFDWARECPGDFTPTVPAPGTPTGARTAICAAANALAARVVTR